LGDRGQEIGSQQQQKGAGTVTAKDIEGDPLVEVLDPDQYIATITDPNIRT